MHNLKGKYLLSFMSIQKKLSKEKRNDDTTDSDVTDDAPNMIKESEESKNITNREDISPKSSSKKSPISHPIRGKTMNWYEKYSLHINEPKNKPKESENVKEQDCDNIDLEKIFLNLLAKCEQYKHLQTDIPQNCITQDTESCQKESSDSPKEHIFSDRVKPPENKSNNSTFTKDELGSGGDVRCLDSKYYTNIQENSSNCHTRNTCENQTDMNEFRNIETSGENSHPRQKHSTTVNLYSELFHLQPKYKKKYIKTMQELDYPDYVTKSAKKCYLSNLLHSKNNISNSSVYNKGSIQKSISKDEKGISSERNIISGDNNENIFLKKRLFNLQHETISDETDLQALLTEITNQCTQSKIKNYEHKKDIAFIDRAIYRGTVSDFQECKIDTSDSLNNLELSFTNTPSKHKQTNRLEFDTLKKFVESGLDVNLPLPGGQTPLTFIISTATSHRWVDMVRFLLEEGASTNVRDSEGKPLLSLLASSGQLSLIRLAVSKGADIHAVGPGGETPLLTAIHFRQLECMRYFLSQGADPNILSDDGNSALMWALIGPNGLGSQRFNVCVKILLDYGAHPNIQNPYGDTPLMAATLIEDPEIIKRIIAAGGDPNAKNLNGEAALHLATRFDCSNAVRTLLKEGADPNIQDKLGCTPLMETTSESIIYILLDNGADPNIASNTGDISLHLHSKADQADLSLALIEYGSILSPRNFKGDTPLQLAVRSRSQKAIELLLNSGSEVNNINTSGVSIIQDAILPFDFYNTMDIFTILSTRDLMKELLEYTRGQEVISLVEKLIHLGANADHIAEKGITSLMLAAAIGDLKLSELLLSSGALVNGADESGRTALAYACRWGHAHVVDCLLMHGSMVNTIDNFGNLPIFYAAQFDHFDVISMLMVELAFFYVAYHFH